MTPQQTMQQLQNANINQMQMGNMNMNQMNPQHMQQQYQQPTQNQMMVQQMAQQQGVGPGGVHTGAMGGMMGQQQQSVSNQMGFVGTGTGGVNPMANQIGNQNVAGSNQPWAGYSSMQQQTPQQQQQQMFYNQNLGQPTMNRFDRPQLNTNPKQMLSNMLRARGVSPGAAGFMQQAQRNPQQPFMRGPIRPGMPNQMVGSGINAAAGGTMMGSGGSMIQTNLIAQQGSGMVNQGLGNTGMSGNALIGQAAGNTNASGMGNAGIMGMQNIQQSNNINAGMVNQGMNPGMGNPGMLGQGQGATNTGSLNNPNMMGMQNMPQGGMQSGMFQGQGGPYQNMNQNYPNYGNQGLAQQGAQTMMNSFNQMGQQRTSQQEYMAQQRALAARGGQYGQHAPNVTMNNMVNQGTVPPYPRPGNTGTAAAQNQQLQQQQQRFRQQMLIQQQQGNPNTVHKNYNDFYTTILQVWPSKGTIKEWYKIKAKV